MEEILKVTGWLLFSAVKFLIAPGSIYIFGGYSFWETIIISVSGGWLGILSFYFFGKFIYRFYDWLKYRINFGTGKKRKMTKTNRLIVAVKNHRLGLVGLALITPSIISIPVGCMLAAKFFNHDKRTIPLLLLSVVLWGFILTSLVSVFDIRW